MYGRTSPLFVALRFGVTYRLLHDNCQTFCLRLLECIRTPTGLRDIFEGLECIPQELSNGILLQRCKEFNRTQIVSEKSFMASLEQTPLSIGTVFCLLVQIIPVVLVAFFWRSVVAILVALGIGCFYAECSPTAPLKPISRFLWRPPPQDELCLTVYRKLYPDEECATDPPKEQSDVTLALGPPHYWEGSKT